MKSAIKAELSLLKPGTNLVQVESICRIAIEQNAIAVCIPPLFVKIAAAILKDSSVKLATVVGYPYGYSAIEAKVAETILAIVDGADELNIVINTSALKSNDWQYLAKEIGTILPIVRKQLKNITVVLESNLLTEDELIKCCDLYGAAGVDFISVSTGISDNADDLTVIKTVRQHLADKVQIKAGTDAKTYTFAKALIEAGAGRITTTSVAGLLREDTTQA